MILHMVPIRESMKSNIRFQWWILFGGVTLLGIKFSAYFLTNSNAILSDALESIVNVSAAAFALFSLTYSARPKDENHPYGHGKIEFLSSGVEGFLVLIAGFSIVWKGIYNLFYPIEVTNLDLGIYITAFAGLVNYVMGHLMARRGKKLGSLLLEAGGKHLKTDAYTTVALILGLGAMHLFGWIWLDSTIAAIFGIYIMIEGYKIVRRSLAGIMDEADFELIDKLAKYLEGSRKDKWIDMHNLRVIKYGSTLHIDAHLTLPWYMTVEQGHFELDELEKTIEGKFGDRVELFIHVDPCIPHCCKLCQLKCQERQHEFQTRIPWTSENLLSPVKHKVEGETESPEDD